MSITYTTAPNFGQLTVPMASSCSALAEAFNDRLKAGLGNPTQRINLYVMNLYRSIRNPSDDIVPNYPSQYEWSAYYSYFDPVNDQYPDIDAGTYTGANEANPAMSIIFGSDDQGGNTEGEGDTFNKFSLMIGTGGSPETYWEWAKSQRGGYDPISGSQYAPMLEMAQSHSMHVFPWYSRYHKSYGGYLPVPEENTDCTCTDPDGFTYRNWKYKWTNIDTGDVTEFDGVCPPDWSSGTCDTNNHVAYVYRGPYSDKVWTYGGDYYEFLKSDYIEGPYEYGGYLDRTDGDQINRLMINPWMMGFRGTGAQRAANCFDIREIAFSNFEFYSSQYLLAPAYATTIDDEIDVQYPTYTIGTGASLPSGTTSTAHNTPSGFVVGGFLVVPHGLAGSTTFQAVSASVVVGDYTLSADTPAVYNFTSQSLKQLQFKLSSTANFTSSTGHIDFESSDLYEYKPQLEDGYAVMRMCYSQADDDDTLDTIGENESQAQLAYDYYISTSCAVNIHDNTEVYQQTQHANTNPLLDASRRWCNNWTRVINCTDLGLEWDDPNAQVLMGYEVVDNKSSLYFKRYTSNGDDMWAGILNTADTSSNGIVTEAATGSWTNEWLMFMNGKCYSDQESNIYKPSVYSNYFPFIQRAHILPGNNYNELNDSQAQFMRFALDWFPTWTKNIRNQDILSPETLDAYTYDRGLNIDWASLNSLATSSVDTRGTAEKEQARKFYTSAQIYKKDYVVESATGELWDDGTPVVKITFTERIQNHEDAPLYISKNIATWDKTAIQDQDYRTDENSIQQFLIWQDDGTNAQRKLGDQEVSYTPVYEAYPRYGAIWNTFYFTKLIPKPYVVSDTGSCHCTNYESPPMTIDQVVQMEVFLRAMCEGFVDDTVSTTYACDSDFNSAYDYTYENLIYDATNGSNTSIPLMATATRPDKAKSYGPLANMRIDAATINTIAAAVNKLNKVRLIIPWQLLTTTQYYYGQENKTADITPAGCSQNAESWGIFLGYAGAQALTPNGEFYSWYDNTFVSEVSLTWVDTTPNPCQVGDCFGDDWVLRTDRTAVSYSFQLIDPLLGNAIHEDILELIDTPGQAGFFGTYQSTSSYYEVESYDPTVGGYDPSSYCGDCAAQLVYESDANTAYKFTLNETTQSGCAFFTNGVVDLGEQMPAGDVSFGISKCGNAISCNNQRCSNVGTSRYIVDVKNTRDIILTVPLS